MGLKDILLGNYSKRQLKKIEPIKRAVLELEEKYKGYTDEQLRECTEDFKNRVQTGATLDDILPEAFAVCREAADRVLGMRPYPVQIVGGIVLHQGRIAEMKTGEGKTLVATMPAYLNALAGKGVHIVTVNDYLAKRDSEWMGKLYRFLGLKVGLIVHDLKPQERKAAYDADITYCTNNELGFDYLRDNMVNYKENRVQRGHSFAIVDEVDSILIDEARTPLIISGQGDKSTELYTLAERFAKSLTYKKVKEVDAKADNDEEYAGIDCIVDEKAKTATLTAQGIDRAEQFFHVSDLNDTESDPKNLEILHHINQALRAHGIMQKDIDYVVKDGEVIIVDEFTGRLMFGRRYNEGLHQAIEAKEGVKIENESKTLATITFQNFFRLYDKLSGMTGTAMTESQEFSEIYKLDVVEIPTNKPLARKDEPDVVYKTEQAKFNAVIDNIVACHEKGQPVLVGTISIEKSEHLSKMLKGRKIAHNVLNAKNHEKEAEIIAQAGKFGAVTIATNMAGRGTDIILGGNAEYMATAEMRKRGIPDDIIAEAKGFAETDNEEFLEARKLFTDLQAQYKQELAPEAEKVLNVGGLYIIGTERHESRRIDNQLRGRAGRQGDVGQSKFYVSLEDDLMRLFGGERLYNMMERLKVEDDMPIEAGILGKTIENAQQKIEYRNFTQRKNVLEYDDVMNVQRTVIYKERNQVLDGDDIHDKIIKMIDAFIAETAKGYFAHDLVEDWDFEGLKANLASWLPADDIIDEQTKDLNNVTADGIIDALCERAHEHIAEKEEQVGKDTMRELERVVLLYAVDTHWMDHIDAMDELRNGIRLRAYGQQDPVVAYRNEGYDMFEAMNNEIREDTVKRILTVQIRNEEDMERKQVAKITSESGASDEGEVKKQPVKVAKKIGRNDPCPCGSGKKYKKCCGRDAE